MINEEVLEVCVLLFIKKKIIRRLVSKKKKLYELALSF